MEIALLRIEILFCIIILSQFFICHANFEEKRQFLATFGPSMGENCSGTLLHNFTDSRDFSYQEDTLEVVANGLWRISSLGDEGNWFNSYVSGVGGYLCQKFWLTHATKQVKVERFGDPYQEAKELNIYRGPYFMGWNTRVKDSVSFPSPLRVESWHFTGNHSWTLFSEKDFKGRAQCLEAQLNGNGWGITWEGINSKMTFVGSVRAECREGTGSKSSTTSGSSKDIMKSLNGCILVLSLLIGMQ